MEQGIQFISNFKDWKAVKKLTISEKTKDFFILEFFASFLYSVEEKADMYMEKTGDLEELKKIIDTGNTLQEKLALIRSRQISSLMNSFIEKQNLEKKNQKLMKDFLLVYANRYALEKEKVKISYGDVEVAAVKKLKKGKK